MHACMHILFVHDQHLPMFLSLQMEDILSLHESECQKKDPYRAVVISADGVAECKSNSNSLYFFSVKFKNCRTVYPHTLVRPLGKYKIDPKTYFKIFVEDLLHSGCHIKTFVGDNPMRSMARNALSHSSSYACEYCSIKGITLHLNDNDKEARKKDLDFEKLILEEKINQMRANDDEEEEIVKVASIIKGINTSLKQLGRKTSRVVWPSRTSNGPLRTKNEIIDIVKLLEDNACSRDDAKGFLGRSPLLDIPYFNFVTHSPAEYLQCVFGCGEKNG